MGGNKKKKVLSKRDTEDDPRLYVVYYSTCHRRLRIHGAVIVIEHPREDSSHSSLYSQLRTHRNIRIPRRGHPKAYTKREKKTGNKWERRKKQAREGNTRKHGGTHSISHVNANNFFISFSLRQLLSPKKISYSSIMRCSASISYHTSSSRQHKAK